MRICCCAYETKVGRLLLAADETALVAVRFPTGSRAAGPDDGWEERENAVIEQAREQLAEYFEGARRRFSIALRPEGTAFQKKVWEALQQIPYGATVSYGELASTLGDSKSVRAVGTANGANPLPIVIPCHRVVGANGSLVGYGGGLQAKRALLELEQQNSGLFAR